MTAWPSPPAGFVLHEQGTSALYADRDALAGSLALGLASVDGWTRALAGGIRGGRGTTAVVAGDDRGRWRLKALRRGGALSGLWRDRYPGAARALALLGATVEAAARGVPTAAAIALFVARDPGGWVRGFFAVRDLEGFEDMGARLRRGALDERDLAAALATVRGMHDRGVIHPDLNLGNVLLRARPGAAPEVALIDFDRARFLPGPAPFSARQAAVRRLERSCAKITGSAGPLGVGSERLWYDAYAGSDPALQARLDRGRVLGRLALAAHRARWRISGS